VRSLCNSWAICCFFHSYCDAFPVARPTVLKHWRKLEALTIAKESHLLASSFLVSLPHEFSTFSFYLRISLWSLWYHKFLQQISDNEFHVFVIVLLKSSTLFLMFEEVTCLYVFTCITIMYSFSCLSGWNTNTGTNKNTLLYYLSIVCLLMCSFRPTCGTEVVYITLLKRTLVPSP